ncbi:Ku protein [Nakamurella aerolata]|uniref:Non-homologous end joining protein Ku n=1 Tax=Nakamurella aerolata TaxID=1656892 RepID=A0A849AB26_9ACTN|nr:Ku protein [Nakamurella aerolata]NNG36348.1 Ku protein [Nakamurella aerolata]
MRSIWKGSVAFGLVNVPVRLYSATEDRDVKFHQVHAKDGGRIRYQRVCELDGEVVPFSDIEKAYDSEDGQTVVLSADDFASLPVEEDREITVQSFVPADQIDPLMFEKAYYLEPASKSAKPYQLLLQTLQDTDRMAIVSFALRQKTRLAALRVRDGVLVLQTLLWPDEVRQAEFPALDNDAKVAPAEKKMAAMLVDSYADDFHPENYTDTYREELQQLIDAKLEGGEAFPAKESDDEGEDAEVVDLLAALKRSVARRKEASGGGKDNGSNDDDVKENDGRENDGKENDGKDDKKPAAASSRSTRASSKTSGTRSSSSKSSGDKESTTKKKEPAARRTKKAG